MSTLQAGHCSVLCSVNSELPAFLIYPLACPVIPLSGVNKYLLFGMPYGLNFRLKVVDSNRQKNYIVTLDCQLGASNDVKLLLKSKKSNWIALTAADGLISAQVGFFFSACGRTPPPLPAVRDFRSASPLQFVELWELMQRYAYILLHG
jgi:hypothetical protein